jgi:cation:H+ antiporter
MTVAVILFIIGLLFLIKGGDWFVDGSTGLAHRFHVPELLIGATVVSIGTTLPEIMVSATSAISGHGEIAYGNAIGSIICNTALIAAITITIRPQKVDTRTFRTPVIFFFIAAAYYLINAYLLGSFNRTSGLLLLAMFVIYMALTIYQVKKMPAGNASGNNVSADNASADTASGNNISANNASGNNVSADNVSADTASDANTSLAKDLLLLVVGAALIAIGANLLVDNGTLIAEALGVPESVIALTFVALGTSLPELVTAITSLAKGHGALSLGNIIGANLFNLVLVCGVSITLSPFNIPQNKMLAGMNASLILDLPVMLFVMAFLTLPALVRGKLSRFQGIILLIVYAAFCIIQFLL